jgi:inhibitor of cysteine peptidase
MQATMSTTTVFRPVKPATVLIIITVITLVAVAAFALAEMVNTNEAVGVIGPAQAGSTITLAAGEQFTVTLPGNPSTGYSWVVTTINPALLTQIGEPEFSTGSDLVGAGGTITFRFEATGAGQDAMQLDYLRPWEDVEPIDTYRVTVNVR